MMNKWLCLPGLLALESSAFGSHLLCRLPLGGSDDSGLKGPGQPLLSVRLLPRFKPPSQAREKRHAGHASAAALRSSAQQLKQLVAKVLLDPRAVLPAGVLDVLVVRQIPCKRKNTSGKGGMGEKKEKYIREGQENFENREKSAFCSCLSRLFFLSFFFLFK